VGCTKRGKGCKIMAVADSAGLPLSIHVTSATPHEVTLVSDTIFSRFTQEQPLRLIGDRAYDSDALDEELREEGIELISPHRSGRVKEPTQDGRPLRRYKRRWKVERLFAWLHNFRRVVVRWERHAENYGGMVLLACIVILLRNYL
jgi:transposase